MSQSSTIVLLPFIAAIITFVMVFYGRERAGSKTSHNFLSAVGSVVILASYLLLRVVEMMSVTLNIVYAAIGVALLIWAFVCTRI